MAVKIRLRRIGRKNDPFYEVVATNSRASRSGMYLQKLGTYNPKNKDSSVNVEESLKWISNGAIPTESAARVLSKEGVLLKKHLQMGVKKGAISQEAAEEKFQKWRATKNA